MSMDVSRLAIEVTTTGIKEASTALGGLSRTAGNTDAKVQSLTANLAKLMQGAGNTTGAVSGLSGTMALINSALQSASASATAMAQALAQAQQGMNNLTQGANKATNALREKNKWAGTTVTTLKAMSVAAATYLGFNFVKHSLQAADSWVLMQAKLKIATGSMENAKVAQNDLYEMSQRLRVPMEAQLKLFTRMAPAMRNNKKSYEDTKDVVEGVALALQLNGATAGEASSVMLQFSQSMQKGYLDGAEFNAIAENGSLLMQALARETGKSTGELKKMGSQGKITRELIQKAIQSNLKQWREDFASLPVTIDGALQRIKNAWMKAMGELSSDAGTNAGLVKALRVVEDMIPAIRDGLTSAFISVAMWVDRNRDGISAVWDQAKGLLSDVWNIVSAVISLGGAFSDSTDGVNVLSFAIFSIRLALAYAVDIVKMMGIAFVHVGAYVTDFFLSPMWLAVKAVEMVASKIGLTFELLAKGASAVGLDSVAKMFNDAAGGVQNFVDGAKDLGANIKGIGESARDMANSWGAGQTEVEKLLNSSKEINLEVKKTAKLNRDAWNKPTGPADKPPVDKEAEKAHNKAMREANSEMEKSLKLYTELAQTYELIQRYGLDHDKLTEGEKALIKIDRELLIVKDAQAKAVLQQARATALAAIEIEKVNKLQLDTLKMDQEEAKHQGEKIAAAEKEARVLQDKINNFDKAKGAVESLALAQAQANLQAMIEGGETEASIERQRRLVDALQKVQDKTVELGGLEAGKKLDELLDPKKAIDFGNNLESAFGKAGKAMNSLVKGLEQYDKRASKIDTIRKQAEKVKLTDQKKYTEAMSEATDLEVRSRLEGYADMIGAAKNFFKEGTTGYKALEAAERAFRLIEMVLALKNFAEKSGLLTAFTTATVAAQTEQTASTVSGASTEISAKMAVANANAVAGVANQANGDPYSAFFRMAAMAAIMAGLGLAVSGGGGGGAVQTADQIKSDHQKANGTGTVLGDDTAKSESIKNSLDRMRDNSNIGLVYTSEMLASLRNIDLKMGGMTAQVARIPGLTTGKNFMNANIGTRTSGITGLFGSTTTREIADTGLAVSGRISDLINGGAMRQYLDILQTKKSSGFLGIGSSTKTSQSREYQGVDSQLAATVGSIFSDINDTIIQAGTSLGLSGDEMARRLNEFVINAEVSLKDLKGDDLSKALEAFFSSSADQLAMYAAGAFSQFQKTGEGYFETLTRVATQTEQAKDALGKLGVSMINLWDVSNKTADLNTELVRDSLIRQEAGTSLANIMRLLDGSMEDLIANYKELTRIRNSMVAMGVNGNNLSLDLIRGAGGINALADAFDTYTENFYSQEEQTQLKMSQLTMEFGRLGVAVPQSRDAFRTLVTQLMQGGAASQEMAGRILALAGDFNDAMEMYDETTGSLITNAKDALREAYDREAEALQNTIDKMKDFTDSLKEFKNSLIMGDLSPLSEMEKYQTALAKYNDVSTRALAGDEDAIAKFQDVASELLKYSQSVNASGANYLTDFNNVLAATEALSQYTQGQADSATTQLDALNQQVETLISIDETVKTVAQAIEELLAVMGGGTTTLAAADALSADPLVPVTSTDTTAPPLTTPTAETTAATQAAQSQQSQSNMIAELQGLRTELIAIRNQVQVSGEQVSGATYGAADAAADKVVAGYKSVQQSVTYYRPLEIA